VPEHAGGTIQPQDEEQRQVPCLPRARNGMLVQLVSNGFVLSSPQGWTMVVSGGGGEEATSFSLNTSPD